VRSPQPSARPTGDIQGSPRTAECEHRVQVLRRRHNPGCELRVLPQPDLSSHLRHQARIVETGATKVTQLYTKMVAEGSAGIPPGGPEFSFTPFDPSLRLQLTPIVAFLRTLPLPATHPNHPAALAIQSTLRDAQRSHGEMRGIWSRKCLEPHCKRLLERSETMDGVRAGRDVGRWVQNMLTVAEVLLNTSSLKSYL
jgi:hypothetical protein